MKLYIPNISKQAVGGGWTFLRNLREALKLDAHFVGTVDECDIMFIFGVTVTDMSEVLKAKGLGKKIVLRVDNVPRKSRNRRCTPHERMKEIADLADVVVYQSEWCKKYAEILCGDGPIIYNGVDKKIFYPSEKTKDKDLYFFAYHGKSELKCFWQAHYHYQMIHRENSNAEFWFIYDFGRDLDELSKANYDFWNGEKYRHMDMIDDPTSFANVLRQCKALVYPSVADAAPNIVLEARACGLDVIGASDIGGTKELLKPELDISLERMGREYLSLFKLLLSD